MVLIYSFLKLIILLKEKMQMENKNQIMLYSQTGYNAMFCLTTGLEHH
jgi:hypothetical protein